MSDPCELSLTEVAAAIRSRELSALEVTEACLAKISGAQPQLNCFIAIEAEEARTAARKADAALAKGENAGPLTGVPLAHKDMFYRAGRVSTCGSKIRRDWIADRTSTALTRLDSAGALQLGRLNMAEFAYGPTGHNEHFGHCRNPWNTDYITGGSSSGSGAAVAARLVYGALGSDTGGSVRAPAGFCGVSGIKPTWGRVSRKGAMPISHTLDTVGPLARSVADCALLLGVIAGRDEGDPESSAEPVADYTAALSDPSKGLRIAVPRALIEREVDPEIVKALLAATAVMRDAGMIITESRDETAGPDLDLLSAHCMIVMQAEAASLHAPWMRERQQDYSSQTRARLEPGYAIPAAVYLDSLRVRGAALERFCRDTLDEADMLLLPVMSIPTPTIAATDVGGGPDMVKTIGETTRYLRWVNYLGVPSIALPCGFDSRGLPIGMQLVGRPFGEARLFTAGHAYQLATDWHRRAPPG